MKGKTGISKKIDSGIANLAGKSTELERPGTFFGPVTVKRPRPLGADRCTNQAYVTLIVKLLITLGLPPIKKWNCYMAMSYPSHSSLHVFTLLGVIASVCTELLTTSNICRTIAPTTANGRELLRLFARGPKENLRADVSSFSPSSPLQRMMKG